MMLVLPPTVITHTHNVSLALAAIVVSIVAAITGLALMNNIRTLPESRRKAVIVMAAFLLGGGIWSMHFLAMLSIQFSVPIHYDLLQTLSSGLIAVLVVGFALLLLHFRARTRSVLNTAGLCLGVGIVSMHIVGMLGMRGVIPDFNSVALFMALILALLMGVAAIRVSYGSRSRQNIIKGGVMFGLAVVVVHYTAMIGTHFSIESDYQEPTIALNQGALAIVVTVAAFVICGTFLLAASTFVPSVGYATTAAPDLAVGEPVLPISADPLDQQQHNAMVENPETILMEPVREQSRKSSDEKLRSIGQEYSSEVQQEQANQPVHQPPKEVAVDPVDSELSVKIPYEQHKQISFIDSGEVGAIRADGRYTQLYTRDGVKFCPWSITEAEERLAGARFYRSHRSYLINVSAVAGFEKNRDSGVCRFEGFTHLNNVPVSRARVGELVVELGL